MLAGVVLINTNNRVPMLNSLTPGDSLLQLILALGLIIAGFVMFVRQLKPYKKKKPQTAKTQDKFLEIFGLE